MRQLILLTMFCCVACAKPQTDVRVDITSEGLHITGLPALSEDGRFVLVQNGPTLVEMAVHSDEVKSWTVQPVEDGEGVVVLPTNREEIGEAVDIVEARVWRTLSGTLAREAHEHEDVFVGRSIRVSASRLSTMVEPVLSEPTMDTTMETTMEQTMEPIIEPMLKLTLDGRTVQVPHEGEELIGAVVAPDRSFVLLTVWGCACECAEWSFVVPTEA